MKSIVVNEMLHRRDVKRHVTFKRVLVHGRPRAKPRTYVHTRTCARMDVGPFEVVPRQRRTITQQNVPRVFVFLRQSLGNTRSTRH